MVVVRSQVKDVAGDFRVSADFYDTLDKNVKDMIGQAKKRAEANGRKTLRPEDL